MDGKRIEHMIQFILLKVFRMKISEEKLAKILQFIKFGVVGLSNTAISYVVYVILIAMHAHYLAASLLGFFISVINAFYWNNKYVFKACEGEERKLWSSFLKTFMSYAGTGVVLNNILLIIWVSVFGMHEMLGPIVNLFITIPLNFFLNKYWAFREAKEKGRHQEEKKSEIRQRE